MSKYQLRVVTNSELTTERRCSREHHFAFNLGIRPAGNEDKEALRFGSLIHYGLEAWWLGEGLDAALAAAIPHAIDAFEAARSRVLLQGYDARWEPTRGEYEVVGVEREFRAPLINPETGHASRTFVIGGKLDVLLRRSFIEHKTTGLDIAPGSVYWRKLTMNTQVSTYYAGAKSLGHEVESCIYDVIHKIALRPKGVPLVDEDGVKIVLDANGERVRVKTGKKWRETGDAEAGYVLQTRPETVEEYEARCFEEVAANPDKYYQRREIVRLAHEEREAQLDTWQQARAIREAELAETFPRNPDACERFGGLCSYFSVCSGEATLDDPALFEKVANVHPELSQPSEAAE